MTYLRKKFPIRKTGSKKKRSRFLNPSTIRGKIFISFCTVFFISGGLAAYSILNTVKANALAEVLILEDSRELTILQDLRFNMAERLKLVNNFLLDGAPNSIDKFRENMKNSQALEKELIQKITGDKAEEQIKKVIADGAKWNELIISNVVDVYQKGEKRQALLNLGAEQFKAEQTMLAMKSLAEEKQQRVEVMGNDMIKSGNQVSIWTFIFTLAAGGLFIYVAVILSRSICNPIRKLSERIEKVAGGDFSQPEIDNSGKDELGDLTNTFNSMVMDLRQLIQQATSTTIQVSTSAKELSASSEETSQSTEQITSSIQEVASASTTQLDSVNETLQTMNELNESLVTLTDSINELESSATQVAVVATSGNDVVLGAVDQMTLINHSVRDVSLILETLGKRSKEISQITEVITSIAEQTNLLALNAAIEAARAGEHGKGFAVVADEVRKLAVQSKDSSKQIVHVITQIQQDTQNVIQAMNKSTKDVKEGRLVVNKAGESFGEIAQSVEVISYSINSINDFVETMASSFDRVTANIHLLTDLAEDNSVYSRTVAHSAEQQLATIEEITASAQTVNDMTLQLTNVLQKFKI